MAVYASDALKQRLFDTIEIHSQDNPLYKDKEKVYLKYNKIEIYQENPMEISLKFFFNGVCNYTLKVDADLPSGQTLIVHGIEGTMEMEVSFL